MKRRMIRGLSLGLATAALFSAPAQAVPDEGGGAGPTIPAPEVRVEGFDWSDAGIGIGIGAAGAAVAVGTALAMRRHRVLPQDMARPAAR